MRQLRVVLDERGDLVAIAFRHADVGKDDVGALGPQAIDRLPPVADRGDGDVFIRET